MFKWNNVLKKLKKSLTIYLSIHLSNCMFQSISGNPTRRREEGLRDVMRTHTDLRACYWIYTKWYLNHFILPASSVFIGCFRQSSGIVIYESSEAVDWVRSNYNK